MFDTIDGPQQFYGTIALISADNPASSAVGRFKESSSAYRPWRHCLGSLNQIKNEVCMLLFLVLNFFFT